jgi:hypothetical protein
LTLARCQGSFTATATQHQQAQDAVNRILSSQIDNPLDGLRDIRTVRDYLDEMEIRYVKGLRARGVSWAEIAVNVGISRQAAWERWQELDPSDRPRG